MRDIDFSGERPDAITWVRGQIRWHIERIKARPETCFSTWGLVLHSGVLLPFDGRKCPYARAPTASWAWLSRNDKRGFAAAAGDSG